MIAFRVGGALETVIEGETGLFFDEQTPESLRDAIKRFEKLATSDKLLATSLQPLATGFSAAACRANAEWFRAEIKAFLTKYYSDLFAGYVWPEER